MRRVQAILVLVALAALPLVPLLQASEMSACACGCACCLRHAMPFERHAGSMHRAVMFCQHDAFTRVSQCGMKAGHGKIAGVLGPLPPTMLSSLFMLTPPPISLRASLRLVKDSPSGFVPDLFEPPRP